MTGSGPSFADAFGVTLSQAEVDFVIPDLSRDIPVCIDPFLLYKSRDETLRKLHDELLAVFRRGFELFEDGDRPALGRLIDFPEVAAIGFGYTEAGTGGSGLGWHLNQLLADLLGSSEAVRERGLRHVEELQLLSVGVGPDRVSDISANVLKLPLVAYTQEQAALWRIPLTANLPLAHFLDPADTEWLDDYFDLPLNPVTGRPLLLVPRRMVRLLPWINYGDFYSSDARAFLPPKARLPRYPGMSAAKRLEIAKAELVQRIRENPEPLDRYVDRKEREGSGAEPLLHEAPDEEQLRRTADDLIARLRAVPSGQAASGDYQRIVYEILNFLFEPQLTDGQFEVRTYLGTERRDLVYWKEAERSFWAYVRDTYGSPLQMFECKNVDALSLDHVNQTAAYLGARLGMLGVIVTRKAASEATQRKLYSIYNDTPALPRKIILVAADDDLIGMLEAGGATAHMQATYRRFRQSVQ
jgi:hypothetical protein